MGALAVIANLDQFKDRPTFTGAFLQRGASDSFQSCNTATLTIDAPALKHMCCASHADEGKHLEDCLRLYDESLKLIQPGLEGMD